MAAWWPLSFEYLYQQPAAALTFSVCVLEEKTASLQVNRGKLHWAFVFPSSSAHFHPGVFSCPEPHTQTHTHILETFTSLKSALSFTVTNVLHVIDSNRCTIAPLQPVRIDITITFYRVFQFDADINHWRILKSLRMIHHLIFIFFKHKHITIIFDKDNLNVIIKLL